MLIVEVMNLKTWSDNIISALLQFLTIDQNVASLQTKDINSWKCFQWHQNHNKNSLATWYRDRLQNFPPKLGSPIS